MPLIHNVTRQWWLDWFLAAGVKVETLSGGSVVDGYGLAVQFAIEEYGAALARDPLLDRDLASGALMRLFNVSVTPRFAYYVTRDAARPPRREAELLMRWLRSDPANRNS